MGIGVGVTVGVGVSVSIWSGVVIGDEVCWEADCCVDPLAFAIPPQIIQKVSMPVTIHFVFVRHLAYCHMR